MYHNNNRYFYLHAERDSIDEIVKLKDDEFHNIRKEYETSLIKKVEKPVKEQKSKESPPKPRKKVTKADKELRFRHLAYLFRKNVKIIIGKLKRSRLQMKDIFEQKLFSNNPYLHGKHIFESVKAGDEAKVWRQYIENKFIVFSVDSTLKTPLTWACIRGNRAIAELMIGGGALLNKRDILGHSPIYYAIQYRQEECLKLMLLH